VALVGGRRLFLFKFTFGFLDSGNVSLEDVEAYMKMIYRGIDFSMDYLAASLLQLRHLFLEAVERSASRSSEI
jgi:hypothetical protein